MHAVGLALIVISTCAPCVLLRARVLLVAGIARVLVHGGIQSCLMALCGCLRCYADPPLHRQCGFPQRSVFCLEPAATVAPLSLVTRLQEPWLLVCTWRKGAYASCIMRNRHGNLCRCVRHILALQNKGEFADGFRQCTCMVSSLATLKLPVVAFCRPGAFRHRYSVSFTPSSSMSVSFAKRPYTNGIPCNTCLSSVPVQLVRPSAPASS